MLVLGIGHSFQQSGHSWRVTGFVRRDGQWNITATSNTVLHGKTRERQATFTLKQIEEAVL